MLEPLNFEFLKGNSSTFFQVELWPVSNTPCRSLLVRIYVLFIKQGRYIYSRYHIVTKKKFTSYSLVGIYEHLLSSVSIIDGQVLLRNRLHKFQNFIPSGAKYNRSLPSWSDIDLLCKYEPVQRNQIFHRVVLKRINDYKVKTTRQYEFTSSVSSSVRNKTNFFLLQPIQRCEKFANLVAIMELRISRVVNYSHPAVE